MSIAALAVVRPGQRRPDAAWSDAGLVEACVRGDGRAWNELVERYGRLVYSIPRRYGLSAADAEDVYQEVFTIVHRKLGGLRDPSRLSSWLISTTLRECRRLGRRSPKWEPLEEGSHTGEEPPPEQVADWERQQLVRQALRQLGGPCQRLLTALFSSPGTPDYKLIAAQLGMKPGSIGPTRARCFRKLEKILAELGLDELGAGAPPQPAAAAGARLAR